MKSVRESLDDAAFNGKNVEKDQLKSFLKQDLKGVYLVLADLLRTEEAIDALTDVFYSRYLRLKEAKEASPELPWVSADDVRKSSNQE